MRRSSAKALGNSRRSQRAYGETADELQRRDDLAGWLAASEVGESIQRLPRSGCCEIPVVVQTDESHHDGKSNAGATVEAVSRGDVSTLRLPLVPVVEA